MAGKVTAQLVIEGKNNSQKAFAEVNKELSTLSKQLASTGKLIAGYLSFSALSAGIGAVVSAADAYQLMNAKLKLATGSQNEFNVAQQELQRIAAATASPVESLITLYTRISRPLKEAGRSQKDILKVTEAVASSFRVSGASAEEAQNGVIQFAQALGSGALRGDEFNSVAEQAPRLMQALADGIGVPTGALKQLAADGKLTASVVTDALIGQLPKIQQELSGFGDTVGGQMLQIQDAITRGIGNADTGPLIDALKQLRDTINDPAIMANLTVLAAGLITVAQAAATGASNLAIFGKDLGYIAARITGNVDEISRADKEIEKLQAAADGVGILDLYMSDEQIAQKLAEWKAYRQMLLDQQTGMNDELRGKGEEANQIAEILERQREDALRDHAAKVSDIRDEIVKEGEAALNKQVAAEKKAAGELSKAKNEQLDTEKRYKDALAQLSSGSGGEATFGAAMNLKVAARQALGDGNVEQAKQQAQAALKVIQELAAAGENTYGFAGFIKELQQIEASADQLNVDNLSKSAEAAQAKTEQLKTELESIKNAKITPQLDAAQLAAVSTQLQAFAAQMGKELTIPVRLVPGQADAEGYVMVANNPQKPSGYATGGAVRGPGSGTSDSIMARLSNGEYVLRAAAVRQYGTNLLDKMNGLRLPKFADGGLVSAAMSAPAGGSSFGTVNLNLDGHSYQMQANEQNFAELVKRQKWKRGSTRT